LNWVRPAWLIFLLALIYAVLRYHVFGGVPWASLPLYTTNKAVSLAGLALLAAAYLVRRSGLAVRFGLTGLALTAVHVLMSLALLDPAYYPKLYNLAKLHLAGEIAMLCGCVAAILLALPAIASLPALAEALGRRRWSACQRMGYAALAITGIHVLAIGVPGWFAPATWPGGMPPITLLSFLIALAPLGARLRRAQSNAASSIFRK
jgi:DMSO/TMAO reductase YedYZ heme-binding membrane subunit